MISLLKNCLLLSLTVVLFNSCSSVPETAKFIPEDAMVVMSINTKELSKKAAWSAILGSDILARLKKKAETAKSADAASQLDRAGIDFLNTSYLYTVPDKRFENNMRMSVIIPLDDKEKWEAYVASVFPQATIRENNGIKEIIPFDQIVAGWKDKLLIITNVARKSADYNLATDAEDFDREAFLEMLRPKMDTTVSFAELEAAFTIDKEHLLVKNDRFKNLQSESHDLSMWVNYESVMDQSTLNGANTMPLNMISGLWKSNIMTAGVDFEKGQINSIVKYYPSDSLREIYKSFVNAEIDKELINRTKTKNLDLLAGWHLPPAAVRQMLDKLGLTPLASAGLSNAGLSLDTLLDAFTGDMVVALNEFSIVEEKNSIGGNTYTTSKPTLNFTYALKINNQASFNRLLNFLTSSGMLTAVGKGRYVAGNANNPSMQMLSDKDYVVVADKMENATAWMSGDANKQKLSKPAADAVYGHAMGVFIDFKKITSNITLPKGTTTKDSTILTEGKKLIDYMSMSTNEFKSDSYNSTFTIAFQDKDENSLLQLIDFAMKAGEVQENTPTASR